MMFERIGRIFARIKELAGGVRPVGPFATLPQEGQKYRHKTTGFIATCTGRTSGGAIFSFLDLTEPSDMAKVKDYQRDDFELIEPEVRE